MRKRMICIAGDKQQTFSGLKNYTNMRALENYEVTTAGDGVVPHTLSQLRDTKGGYVATYFVEATNANLPANPNILGALNGLLESGQTNDLPEVQRISKKLSASDQKAALEQVNISQSNLNKQLSQLSQQVRSLATDATQVTTFSSEELKLEELITFGPLTESTKKSLAAPAPPAIEFEVPSIEVGLVYDQIASINYGRILSTTGDPVDSIAVGHYIGVLPQGPELYLDRVISTEKTGRSAPAEESVERKVITDTVHAMGNHSWRTRPPIFLERPAYDSTQEPVKTAPYRHRRNGATGALWRS